MIDSLISSPTIRMLEQTLDFTEQRHNVLLEDIANVSTPGYVQKDVSVAAFQKSLQEAVARKWASNNNDYEPESNGVVDFTPGVSTVQVKPAEVVNNVGFHDRGVRSMEYLMGQLADNAMAHNTISQLLKNRYDLTAKAIKMQA
ncbi:MAG: flagellar basal body rod protein FlgB [Phycisphaerae bacterium]